MLFPVDSDRPRLSDITMAGVTNSSGSIDWRPLLSEWLGSDSEPASFPVTHGVGGEPTCRQFFNCIDWLIWLFFIFKGSRFASLFICSFEHTFCSMDHTRSLLNIRRYARSRCLPYHSPTEIGLFMRWRMVSQPMTGRVLSSRWSSPGTHSFFPRTYMILLLTWVVTQV